MYIDGDSRQRNDENRPLGVKNLNGKLAAETKAETETETEYWTCLGLVDTWFKLLGAAEHSFSQTPSG